MKKPKPLVHILYSIFLFLLPKRRWLRRVTLIILACLLLCVGGMYSVAQWYIYKHRNEPVQLGATFIPDYARSFGLDPQQTMSAIIYELGVKNLRLVSYWSNGEPQPGHYDFSELDWEFKMAEAAGVKINLALGLRQPRWPECHMPDWATSEPQSQWQPQLENYITAVVNRYKNSSALSAYQLENEYFLKAFGMCTNYDRQRLVSEYNLVKSLDPKHTLVVSMSNNAIGTPVGAPTPDEFAISVYERVWDKTITKRYFEYPIPAWYYAFRAGWVELTRGRNSFIHELQAEAWLPDGYDIRTAPTSELYKSLSPQRLSDRFQYGEATGMKEIDLWGVEWWYAMKVNRHDPALWNIAKQQYAQANTHNANLPH